MTTTKDIFTVLLKLDKRDLKQIKNRTEYLLQSNNSEDADTFDKEHDIFNDCMRDRIYSMLKVKQHYLGVHKKKHKKLYEKLYNVKNSIDDYLKELLKPTVVKRVMLQKWYILYCELVCEYIMDSTNLHLTITEILDTVDKFPELLNDAFLNYIESGLIYLILK